MSWFADAHFKSAKFLLNRESLKFLIVDMEKGTLF